MDETQFQGLLNAIQNSSNKDLFDYLVAISSFVISVVALIIGVRINQKFSLKNQMLQKQLETVYKLVETLQNQRFTIIVREKPETAGMICETSFFEITSLGKDNKTLFNALNLKDPFYYTWSGYESLEFVKFSTNPYTPKIIAKLLNEYRYLAKSDPGNMVMEREDRKVQVYLIPTRKDNSHDDKKPDPWYVKGKRIHTDFSTFVQVSIELNETIKMWLKKYEVDDLNF